MHNTLDGSQPYPGAFKRLSGVQTLKYAKELVYIFHIETDSIVTNEHHDLIWGSVRASDFNFGRRSRAREFNGIRDQVDECQPQHGTVSVHGRQFSDFP